MMPDFAPWKDLWTALGIPAVIGAWQVWWSLRNRGDAREDKAQELLAGQRDRIAADLRADLDTCRGLLDATSKDRYRGWDLARRYYQYLGEFRLGWQMATGEARAARQVADSLARRLPADLAPTWGLPLEGPPPMPPFDDTKPANDK
ncbi:MAG: hypothetical protein JWQ72_2225 [Polaromonas sp.]|nr:hypothetical protein [Polaromonas sp.]